MNIIGVKYPNLNAKLKGMHAKRINRIDLEDIIKQSNLRSAVLLLRAKSDIFKNSDENIDRLEIESLLEENLINDILKIIKLLDKNDKEIFKIFLLQYEIKCIKSIYRKLFSEDKTNDIVIENVKKWTFALFEDIKGIETVETFDDFFNAIKRMKYNKVLMKYRQNKNIFELENEMDKIYFETLYDKIKGEKNLEKIVGSEIDLLNISWIFRIKKYYNFKNKNVKEILINRYYKLNSNITEKIIQTNSFEEIKEIMCKTVYKEIFIEEKDFEENIDKYLYKVNKEIFKEDIMSIAYVFAYVNMIDYENIDIINTIEGIKYNVEKSEILKKLVN